MSDVRSRELNNRPAKGHDSITRLAVYCEVMEMSPSIIMVQVSRGTFNNHIDTDEVRKK